MNWDLHAVGNVSLLWLGIWSDLDIFDWTSHLWLVHFWQFSSIGPCGFICTVDKNMVRQFVPQLLKRSPWEQSRKLWVHRLVSLFIFINSLGCFRFLISFPFSDCMIFWEAYGKGLRCSSESQSSSVLLSKLKVDFMSCISCLQPPRSNSLDAKEALPSLRSFVDHLLINGHQYLGLH